MSAVIVCLDRDGQWCRQAVWPACGSLGCSMTPSVSAQWTSSNVCTGWWAPQSMFETLSVILRGLNAALPRLAHDRFVRQGNRAMG